MSVLPLFAGALVTGGIGVATFAIVDGTPHLVPAYSRYETWLDTHTSFLLSQHTGSRVARGQLFAMCAGVICLLFTRHPVFLALSLAAALGPPYILSKRRSARINRLEQQLDTWLLMLANALKSTSSLGDAIASTAVLIPPPFSEEIDMLVKELRLGMPLDRAIATFSRRVESDSLSAALMTVVVARQTGGDLSSTLEGASAALREAARLEGNLRAKTAEGRGQVLVLALAPFVLGLVITWLDPSWFQAMLVHPYGRAVLVGCATVWLTATVWAQRIAGVEL
jgi:tight adherence protein B